MKSGAFADAARSLGWDAVGARLDAWLEEGRRLLPPPGAAPRPAELHLELTHRCDLKCVMCEHWQMEHLDPASVARELDGAALKAAVKGAALAKGIENVVVTGGEPWLRHDLPELLAFLRAELPSAKIIVLTNLWNTGHLRKRLGELKAAGLLADGKLSLGSSLDGLGATHDSVRGQAGAFDGLTRTVRALKDEFPGLGFGFTFTLVPRNAHELHDAFRFVTEELGVGFGAQWAVQTGGIDPLGWTPEARAAGIAGIRRIAELLCERSGALEKLAAPAAHRGLWSELAYWRYLEEYGRDERRFPFFLRCTSGERHVMVGAEGEVFFCPVNRARTIGNVKEKGLDAIWSSPEAAKEREYVASGKCHCWLRCVSAPATDRLLDLALGVKVGSDPS
jgi:MoaA/NifB/PqqE/SkfB family radical SAM enzyme